MQTLPFWGKRDLRRDVAEADAEQARGARRRPGRTGGAHQDQPTPTTTCVVRNERLTREMLDLMARLEQIAQARYAGGLVPQQDVIRAQVEQTAMRGELLMLESERRQAAGRA